MQQNNILNFESIAELREFASKPTPANAWLHRRYNSDEPSHEKEWCAWFGVGTYQAVQQIFNNGWQEGVEWMLENMTEIETPAVATTIKRRKCRSDSGDEYDWQAGAQGMGDIAWTRTTPRKVTAPRNITLFCALSDNSSHLTHHTEFFWRGAAALFLADRLTTAGYNVEIVAGSRQIFKSEGAPVFQFNVVVKQPDMPIDLNALASSLCLAAFFRTLILSAICALEKNPLEQGTCVATGTIAGPGEYRIWADSKESAKAAIRNTLAAIEQQIS